MVWVIRDEGGKVGTVMRISILVLHEAGTGEYMQKYLVSLASTAIISACIFYSAYFFCDHQHRVHGPHGGDNDGDHGIFDENLTEDEIKDIGAKIESDKSGIIKEIKFVSAEEAWDSFKSEYFGDEEALAEGFADDNPLAGSSSYEIRFKQHHGSGRDGGFIWKDFPESAKVNYSNSAATGLAI